MAVTLFECVCCGDKKRERPRPVDEMLVCTQCATIQIVPLFMKAPRNEVEYPPKAWEGAEGELDLAKFIDLLPAGFAAQWAARLQEYKIPIPQRLYCPNRISKPNQSGLDHCGVLIPGDSKIAKCSTCGGRACRECKELVESTAHVCETTGKDVFDDLTRGKDYQICPNKECGFRIAFEGGCNHIICRCREHFCFLCGQPAHHDSNHFVLGMPCPRWGRPGESNAVYESNGEDDESEGEGDESEGEDDESEEEDDV